MSVRAGPCVQGELFLPALGALGGKLACCHIFLLCLSEKACDYEAAMSCQWLWEQKRVSPSTEGLAGVVKVKGNHIYTSHLSKLAVGHLISVFRFLVVSVANLTVSNLDMCGMSRHIYEYV